MPIFLIYSQKVKMTLFPLIATSIMPGIPYKLVAAIL